MPSLASRLAPSPAESLTRVRSDLRMGLPCVMTHGPTQAVVVAVETLTPERLEALRDLFGAHELVLTAKRARAVMTPAASADLTGEPVRIRPPERSDLVWFRTLADSASDLRVGPRGPLHVLRDGEASVQAFALAMVKSAQLLPAAIVFPLPSGAALPADLEPQPDRHHRGRRADRGPARPAAGRLRAVPAGGR